MQTNSVTPATSRTWKILSLLEWSAEHLSSRGFDDARLNAELLLAHVLHLSRIQLYTQHDRPLDMQELAAYKSLLQRRLKHEPLQYILGETEFMGLPLFVDTSVLIPRPETELLVEKTLETLHSVAKENLDILDIGTGSGNIAVALASRLPHAGVTALDVSAEALAVAARNIERHHLANVTLLQADVFSDFLPGKAFDIIASNPPYISAQDFEQLQPEIKDFEPKIATTDGGDGLRFIRRISGVAAEKLTPGGWLLMEIAFSQSTAVRAIVSGFGFHDVEVFADYAGIPRVVRGRE
jgi:release factor glutamine methyltransferase